MEKAERICSKCQLPKPLTAFPSDRRVSDGCEARCKECKRRWRQGNKARLNEHNKEWRRNNPDKAGAIAKRTYQKNRTAIIDRVRDYRKRHPDKRHHNDLRNKYGLSPEGYADLLLKQNGGCAICGEPPLLNRRLAVDHDHVTGKVRGLLCVTHNRAIGLFGDDPDMLIKAVLYLVENSAERIYLSLAA